MYTTSEYQADASQKQVRGSNWRGVEALWQLSGSYSCNPPRIGCFLVECSECSGADAFKERLLGIMDVELIDTVEFRQWTSLYR